MDGQKVREWEARCIEEQAPACSSHCPVHVDARAIMEHLAAGRFSQAFGVFARSIPFPGIIGRICDHPCESACKRAEAGAPIQIHALERACVEYGFSSLPLRVQRPQVRRRIAVIGAGLSGLTAAFELHIKGHSVALFEAQSQLVPRLYADYAATLPPETIGADLERVLASGIEIRLNTPIALDQAGIENLLQEFEALYLGVGPVACAVDPLMLNGSLEINATTFATRHPKIFAGGALRYGAGYSPITSFYDGRYAAMSIDRYLQGASLEANRDDQGIYASRLVVDSARFPPLPAIAPHNPEAGYSQQEAQQEAARCFPCHCLECVRVCPYLEHYGAYPKRYIREIYNNDGIVLGQHKSNRMLDSCMLCGLCEAVCPNDLSMGEVCLEARESLNAKGKMPASHHDFALRDMAFSQSPAFAMARHQPGHEHSGLLFFPGCQLSASSPRHVEQIYAHLCGAIDGGVGLMLDCCGAPARWAGRQDLFLAQQQVLTQQWAALGKPKIVTACSSCFSTLKHAQPEMEVESLWTVLERVGLPTPAPELSAPPRRLAIHDPCTTRHEAGIRASIRHLLTGIGVEVTELNAPGLSTCCGFGGLASFANPEVSNKVIDQRIAQDPADYLTYCAMCRDNFARRGKRALHILDLLLPGAEDNAARPDPGFSRRQESRARLKTHLLHTLWGESIELEASEPPLLIAPEVHADIERKLILEPDIRQVVRHAEESGVKLIDPENGHSIASYRPTVITYWVEYLASPAGYEIFRAYSHRMELEAKP